MFARTFQGGQIVVDAVAHFLRAFLVGIERQGRRPGKRRAHHRNRAEYIGPDQRTTCRDMGAGVVAEHRVYRPVSHRCDQPQDIAHEVEHAEGREVAVVIAVPSGRASVTALVRRDDVIARRSQRQHDFPPAIGQFRKTVQQQYQWTVLCFVPGLQDMHAQAIVVVHEAAAYAGRQIGLRERRELGHGWIVGAYINVH